MRVGPFAVATSDNGLIYYGLLVRSHDGNGALAVRYSGLTQRASAGNPNLRRIYDV